MDKTKLKMLAINPSTVSHAPSDKLLLPLQYVGLEVEVENLNLAFNQDLQRALQKYWIVEKDGSLRNNGVELCSRPYFGEDLLNSLQDLEDFLPSNVSWSMRTSVHVHLDVRDLDATQLLSIVYMYVFMEYLLFSYSPDRIGSQYCVPWFCSRGRGIEATINALATNNMGDLVSALDELERYTAFNLKAVRKFATIEFRHMYGTNKYFTLVNWINLLMGIRKAADIPPADLLTLINSPSMRESLIEQVYGTWTGLVHDVPNYEFLLKQGASNLREIITRVAYYFLQPEDDSPTIENSSYKRLRKPKIHKNINKGPKIRPRFIAIDDPEEARGDLERFIVANVGMWEDDDEHGDDGDF